jgi:ABC-type molybdate transport system substrate-binding protein
VGRRTLLVMTVVAAVVLAACGGDDGSSASREGAVATVQTIAPLAPLARELVDAYNRTADANIELAVVPANQAAAAVTRGSPAILPGVSLAGTNANSTVIGRQLAIIVVPTGNPAQVTGVGAFAPASGLDTAACGVDTPLGNFAELVLEFGGVRPDPSVVAQGCEADVVARVARGELAAALIFRAFVPIPDGVEVSSIPDDRNIVIDIRYAPATGDADDTSFERFLASGEAERILSRQGFLP